MTQRSVSVPALADYLQGMNCRWAANTQDTFADFAKEMRSLRLQLEAVTGRTRKPTKAGAQCFECGKDLVRRVMPYTAEAAVYRWWVQGAIGPLPLQLIEPTERTGEIEEEHVVTCSGCREQYGAARYAMALKAAAEEAAWVTLDGEQWATPAVLAGHLGRSEHTVRSWAQRGNVRARVEARLLFVHVEDTEARHADRMGRQRMRTTTM